MAHEDADATDSLADALARTLELLSSSADSEAVADELAALSAIYDSTDGEPALTLFSPSPSSRTPSPARSWTPTSSRPLRLLLSTTVSDDHDYPLHILISIPSTYPASEPPLLQLHDTYVGPNLVSDSLFGVILRTFMHEEGLGAGVQWREGEVCLYEGIEWVRERLAEWIQEKEDERRRKEVVRAGVGSLYRIGADEDSEERVRKAVEEEEEPRDASFYADQAFARKLAREEAANAQARPSQGTVCPQIFMSEPIMDRKSVFVGHAAAVRSIEEVNLVMSTLLADKKVARAAHNIYAYRLTTVDGLTLHDCEDDGETAAGGRMAHLLALLDVENVIVVAVRDSLLVGGFLEESEKKKKGGKKK